MIRIHLSNHCSQKRYKTLKHPLQILKREKKHLFRSKALSGIFVSTVVLAILYLFPSATQMEAIEVEQEKAVIEDVKKEVAKLEKKAQTKDVKEQLKELQNTLKEAETAEEALREVVKKNKRSLP